MKLTEAQSHELMRKHGVYLTEACDKCGKLLGPVRFTRKGEDGVWCSRECRDGRQAHAPGVCKHCGALLAGKRRGTLYCSKRCHMREIRANGKDSPLIGNGCIQNTSLTDAILASGYGGSRTAESHA